MWMQWCCDWSYTGFVALTCVALSDVFGDPSWEAWPPIALLDKLGGLVSAWMACNRRAVVSMNNVVPELVVSRDIDHALVGNDAIGLHEVFCVLLETFLDFGVGVLRAIVDSKCVS